MSSSYSNSKAQLVDVETGCQRQQYDHSVRKSVGNAPHECGNHCIVGEMRTTVGSIPSFPNLLPATDKSVVERVPNTQVLANWLSIKEKIKARSDLATWTLRVHASEPSPRDRPRPDGKR